MSSHYGGVEFCTVGVWCGLCPHRDRVVEKPHINLHSDNKAGTLPLSRRKFTFIDIGIVVLRYPSRVCAFLASVPILPLGSNCRIMTTMETRIAINKAIGVDARQSHLSTPVPMIWLHDSDLRTTIHSSASPPPHQSPKRRRSLVRKLGFADNVVECGDAARLGMTEDEIASVWYTSKELSDMAKEDRRMLLVARQFGLHTKVNEFCVRGLESHLSRRSRIEQRVRKAAVLQAVLTEQHNQRLRNVYEPSRLRRKSLAASKPSRKHALYLATQDSLEVLSFRSLDVRGSKTMADPPSAIRRSRSAYDVRPSHEDAMEKIIIDHDTRTIFL